VYIVMETGNCGVMVEVVRGNCFGDVTDNLFRARMDTWRMIHYKQETL
jgi:hypothetical protein